MTAADTVPDTITIAPGLVLTLDDELDGSSPGDRCWSVRTRQGHAWFLWRYATGPADMAWHALPWPGWEDCAQPGRSTFAASREQAVAALAWSYRAWSSR